jgi:hypothetical protein
MGFPLNHGLSRRLTAILADTANTWGNYDNRAVVVAVPLRRIGENPASILENPWLRGKTIRKHLPSLEHNPAKSQLSR